MEIGRGEMAQKNSVPVALACRVPKPTQPTVLNALQRRGPTPTAKGRGRLSDACPSHQDACLVGMGTP